MVSVETTSENSTCRIYLQSVWVTIHNRVGDIISIIFRAAPILVLVSVLGRYLLFS